MKLSVKAEWRNDSISLAPMLFLGLTFIVSGTGKLPGQAEFADYLLKSFWGPATAFIIAHMVPWIELIMGVMLIMRLFPRIVAIFSLPLIAGFVLNNSWAIGQGIEEFPVRASVGHGSLL